MKKVIRVYISGPISIGNKFRNCMTAMEIGDKILEMGMVPFIPHLNQFYNAISPKTTEQWMSWDLAWLLCCDALFKIQGESVGSDLDEKFAKENNILIYVSTGQT